MDGSWIRVPPSCVRSRAHRCRSRFRWAGGRAVGVGADRLRRRNIASPASVVFAVATAFHACTSLAPSCTIQSEKEEEEVGGRGARLAWRLFKPYAGPSPNPHIDPTLVLLWRRLSNAKNQMPYYTGVRLASVPTLLHIGHLQCHPSCPSPAWRPPARAAPRPRNVTVRCGGDVAGQRARDRLLLTAAAARLQTPLGPISHCVLILSHVNGVRPRACPMGPCRALESAGPKSF